MRCLAILGITLATAIAAMPQVNPIPIRFEDVAVIFERWDKNGILETHGTGFFYGDSATGVTFIVTNRHLLLGKDSLHVRFSDRDGIARKYTLDLVDNSGKPYWRAHPDTSIDVALFPVPMDFKVKMIDSQRLKPTAEITLGDIVYFIGFPLTEATTDYRVYPLLRHGVVSYIVKEGFMFGNPPRLCQKGSIFIDATSLGGNSGGPVISIPRAGSKRASLIGVIAGHVSVGENGENADLGIVVPAECIPEVIRQY